MRMSHNFYSKKYKGFVIEHTMYRYQTRKKLGRDFIKKYQWVKINNNVIASRNSLYV